MRGSDAALVEFCFVSRLADGLPEAALLRLARQTAQHNRLYGLTGQIRFDGSSVSQVIEGCWSVVMPLAARIVTDRRHEAISITAFQTIRARRYREWGTAGLDGSFAEGLLARAWDAKVAMLPLTVCRLVHDRKARITVP